MKTHLFPALKLTVIMMVLFAGLYPLVIAGIGKLAPGHGSGETIRFKGHTVGYLNIGQKFTADKYFWSRPSAVDYNAAGSGGSNKGPSNPEYLKAVEGRIDSFLVHNPTVKHSQIPAELVTASGSGLDPDLSPEAAKIQAWRVASVRGIPIEKILELVDSHTERPLFGLFGPPKVNVLKLNIALDELKK